jgi:hypothetical protein
MKKKILIIVAIVGALAITGYYTFQWYLNNHKAESEIVKSNTTTNGTLEKTEAGVELKSFDHLSGKYLSTKDTPATTEVLFETYGATATKGIFRTVNVEANFNESIQASLKVSIESSSVFSNESTRD